MALALLPYPLPPDTASILYLFLSLVNLSFMAIPIQGPAEKSLILMT
jgi:hypothetical protein